MLVELSEDTYGRLKDHAEPFVDSPDTVIRRAIDALSEHRTCAAASQWQDKPSGDHPANGRTASPQGPSPAVDALAASILQAVRADAGRSHAKDVIRRVATALGSRESLDRTKRDVYKAAYNLMRQGFLERPDHGVWELTLEGAEVVEKRGGPAA